MQSTQISSTTTCFAWSRGSSPRGTPAAAPSAPPPASAAAPHGGGRWSWRGHHVMRPRSGWRQNAADAAVVLAVVGAFDLPQLRQLHPLRELRQLLAHRRLPRRLPRRRPRHLRRPPRRARNGVLRPENTTQPQGRSPQG